MRNLKEICKILPNLSIPQNEDDLVLYTNASDRWWSALLTKDHPKWVRIIKILQWVVRSKRIKPLDGTLTRMNYLRLERLLKNGLFLLTNKFILKVNKTQIKAYITNKI